MRRMAALLGSCAALLAFAAGSALGAQEPVVAVRVVAAGGASVENAVVALRPKFPVLSSDAGERSPLVMSQHDLSFDPHVLVAPVGSDVAFPNRDEVRHHVYSFSDAKTFELRLYGGEAEHVVLFDKPGVVPLGCNIHDDMIAFIYVADTPFAATTDAEGFARFDAAPPGDYELVVWHERLRGEEELIRPFALGAQGAEETVTIELRRPRRRDGY